MLKIILGAVLITLATTALAGPNAERPQNCEDILSSGHKVSGTYQIFPNGGSHGHSDETGPGVNVFCDMETDGGGWIVIQKRQEPYSLDCVTSFERDWVEFANGFGNIEGDFWLGLNHIHNLTNPTPYQLRVDLMDWDGEERYATYGTFSVASEADQFKLTVDGYGGDAGDSLSWHNEMMFSTKDRDNDQISDRSCVHIYNGAWWHRNCYASSLNGPYVVGGGNFGHGKGVTWNSWRGTEYSLKQTEMKIRSWDFSQQK